MSYPTRLVWLKPRDEKCVPPYSINDSVSLGEGPGINLMYHYVTSARAIRISYVTTNDRGEIGGGNGGKLLGFRFEVLDARDNVVDNRKEFYDGPRNRKVERAEGFLDAMIGANQVFVYKTDINQPDYHTLTFSIIKPERYINRELPDLPLEICEVTEATDEKASGDGLFIFP